MDGELNTTKKRGVHCAVRVIKITSRHFVRIAVHGWICQTAVHGCMERMMNNE